MSVDFQTIAALVIVAIAVALLVRGALRKKKSHGCGCVTDELKAKLKR